MVYEVFVAIIAGGSGTRFWPLSTPERPKQFLNLFGSKSMLQLTYDRVKNLTDPSRIMVITSRDHIDTVRQHLPEVNLIIGEPKAKDTAAAITLAGSVCQSLSSNAVLVIVPADHIIDPTDKFERIIRSAIEGAAFSGVPYTFGIPPTYPATIYGYLEIGYVAAQHNGLKHYNLKSYLEKPGPHLAEQFISSGNYLWNSGIFVWNVKTLMEEISECLPEHFQRLGKGFDNWDTDLDAAYEGLIKVSVDIGIMEKVQNIRMIPADFYWSDVGGWDAIEKMAGSRGKVYGNDGTSFVFCEDPNETVALLGVDNCIVIRSGNKTLVVSRDKLDEIRELVKKIES